MTDRTRPSHAGPTRPSPQRSLFPQPFEQRQERQAEDGEIVAVDPVEELDAGPSIW